MLRDAYRREDGLWKIVHRHGDHVSNDLRSPATTGTRIDRIRSFEERTRAS